MEWSTSSRVPWLLEATACSWQTLKRAQKSDSGLPRGKGVPGWDQTIPIRKKTIRPGDGEGREVHLEEASLIGNKSVST